MSETTRKVAIVTGGSQGIGAGRRPGGSEAGRSWRIPAILSRRRYLDVLTVEGDVSEQATADRSNTVLNQWHQQ